jgi:FMN phosphatase YigB (HAD superfamily)
MLRAVLFDLDNTLLENDLGVFIPSFLEALAPRFAHIIPPETFKRWMLRSVRQMMVDIDPRQTNREVFMRDMVLRSGYSWTVLGPLFDAFYAEDYAALEAVSRPIELAPRVIDAAIERGLKVAVATNPIFPLVAMTERIRWARLAGCPFEVVTSYDDSHFCKPHPEFYLEVAQRLGCPPEECLMVGDDVVNDMPAVEAGMRTYLVTDHMDARKRAFYEPTFLGTLSDLHEFLSDDALIADL